MIGLGSDKNKLNRCLARYSPRATTTNQPTNRAPNEPAMDKMANFLAISEDFPVKIFMWSKIFWALPFIWCPVGGLVGDCGVRAVPRKTPIYFMVIFIFGIIKEILVAKRHFMTFEILI